MPVGNEKGHWKGYQHFEKGHHGYLHCPIAGAQMQLGPILRGMVGVGERHRTFHPWQLIHTLSLPKARRNGGAMPILRMSISHAVHFPKHPTI